MKELIERPNISKNIKATAVYKQFGALLDVLAKKELPNEIIALINQETEHLNSISDTDKHFLKTIKQKEHKIIKLLENKIKLVPKNYYRKLWLILGMTSFGLPIGIALGLSIGNIGFLGIGLPIGMAIGVGIGSRMDKKAFKEGRQLDFEVKG